MKNRLKIEFRKKQLYLDQDPAQPVVVQCNPDGSAEYVTGMVDQTWIDMTQDVEGLPDLSLSWSAANGDSDSSEGNALGSNVQKGLSADLRYSGAAFHFIYDWLMTDACQSLNAVEARVTDMDCDRTLRLFEIKLDNTEYSPDEECIVDIPLREADEAIHVFKKTIIEDNWQNWFNSEGTSTKDHPTFQMVVEKKPKFFLSILVVLVYIAGMLSLGAVIALNEGKRWISKVLGITYFCPSPLIRDYIKNVCDKYGYTFDTIFDDKPENPYRDLCLFFPASTSLKQFNGANYTSPSTKFIWENRTVLSMAKLLDQLKSVFNAEWYVTPGKKLIFKHKSYFDNQVPIYDFVTDGKIFNLKYTFNGNKKPAYGNYQYQIDPQDTCSNEPKWRYNDLVDFDGPANNPMLEGNVTKQFDFAATAFHNDGTSEDFMEEGIRVGRGVAIGAIITGFITILATTGPLTSIATAALVSGLGYAITNNWMNDYFNNNNLNGMVRVSSSEINTPRLLLWDRTTAISRAKVVSVVNPPMNPFYNLDGKNYYEEHPTFDGDDTFGTTVTKVWNYPMFVDAKFTGNLYQFHEYDNPLKSSTINQTWEGDVDLCCEWLDILGVWDETSIQIGAVVVLERRGNREIKGRLEDITVDYGSGRIRLKGTLLRSLFEVDMGGQPGPYEPPGPVEPPEPPVTKKYVDWVYRDDGTPSLHIGLERWNDNKGLRKKAAEGGGWGYLSMAEDSLVPGKALYFKCVSNISAQGIGASSTHNYFFAPPGWEVAMYQQDNGLAVSWIANANGNENWPYAAGDWFRIKHTGTQFIFEQSTDGITWVTKKTVANSGGSWPIRVDVAGAPTGSGWSEIYLDVI